MSDQLTYPAEWNRSRQRIAVAIAALSVAILIGLVVLALAALWGDDATSPAQTNRELITEFTYSDLEHLCARQSLTVDAQVLCNEGLTPADFATAP